MARTVEECNTYIVTQLTNTFANAGITINSTTWSKRNLIRLLCYSIAIAQSYLEQLWDVAIGKMEAIQSVSAAGSAAWLQNKVFEFQYSLTTPQVLTMTAGVYYYETVNTSLRVVTACAVTSTISNIVNVKAAKGTTTLSALSVGELAALNTYVAHVGTAGITYNVTSTAPDQLYIEGTIYYQGVYSAVIEANVISAIESYLVTLSRVRFGGDILTSDIENLIRNVEGVNDVILERVSCRYDTQTIHTGIDLVLSGDWINRKYTMGAGYLVQEATAGYTFADKLTFIAE